MSTHRIPHLAATAAIFGVPYDCLPGYVWPPISILLVVGALAFTCRFVVHQFILARDELSQLPPEGGRRDLGRLQDGDRRT
jgi:hypothetical protein